MGEKLETPKTTLIVSEHSANTPKAEGQRYPELSEEGIRLATERAEEFAHHIEAAAPGTVFWQGGNSHMARTRSTMEVYSDALHERFRDASEDEIIFISQQDLQESAREGYTKAATRVMKRAQEHPEAKIIIDLPLRTKEISQKDWYLLGGKLKPYQDELIKNHELTKEYGENFSRATREWFAQPDTRAQDDPERVPTPKEVAQSYLQGFKRLEAFARRFFPDRPLRIAVVGHSTELNATLTYLANKGHVTEEAFKKIGDSTIGFTEPAIIEMGDDEIKLEYRGEQFVYEIRNEGM